MPNFDYLLTSGAAEALLAKLQPTNAAVCRGFAQGDHFQKGTQWIGPPPPPSDYLAAMATLKRVFVPVPVVEEMLDGHVTGALGKEPVIEYSFVKDLQEGQERDPQALARQAEVDAEFGTWFDKRGCLTTLQQWLRVMKSAGEGEGRATLRLSIPAGLISTDEDGESTVTPETIEDAYDLIYLDAPDNAHAAVYLDADTKREAGLFSYEIASKRTDSLRREYRTTTKRVEVVYISEATAATETSPAREAGQTVVRTLEGDKVVDEVALDMGGLSLMFEGRLPSMLSAPVLANQRSADMINTMLPLNAAYAGFRKQDMFNVSDRDPAQDEGAEVETGPSQIAFWFSQQYRDPKTNEIKHFPPQLVVTEPVDSESLRKDIEHHDNVIRRAAKQFHTAAHASDNTSAVSKIQSRAAFGQDLRMTTPVAEAAIRWLQMATRCLALYLCDRASEIEAFVDEFKGFAQCKPSTGPLTPEEDRVLIERYKAGLISREDACLIAGVEDITKWIENIDEEASGNLSSLLDKGKLVDQIASTLPVAIAFRIGWYGEDAEAVLREEGLWDSRKQPTPET